MHKYLFKTVCGFLGIMGALLIGVVNAIQTVKPIEGEIITYTLNGDNSRVFTAGVLEINDGENKIYILDRNLGATAAGTGCRDAGRNGLCLQGDDTYGYHFQWGNNYGFKPCTGDKCKTFPNGETSNTQVKASSITYNPSQQQYYSSNTFIIGNTNWLDDNIGNLWGGDVTNLTDGGDGININDENYVLGNDWKVKNAKERQGPCPEGFHVPSIGELTKVESMLGNLINDFYESNNGLEVADDLLLPFPGLRSFVNAGFIYSSRESRGYLAHLWSSSPSSTNTTSYFLQFNSDGLIKKGEIGRANAQSIRCFSNEYDTYKIKSISIPYVPIPALGENTNNVSIAPSSIICDSNCTTKNYGFKVYNGNNWQDVNTNFIADTYRVELSIKADEGYQFADNVNILINNQTGALLNRISDTEITIYLEFAIYATVSEPYGDITYQLNNGESFSAEAITISDCPQQQTSDCTTITILDRNLGADKPGTGEESYGYHFQWGNNYGFDPMDAAVVTDAVEVKTNGAKWESSYTNSGYYGEVFIKSNDEYGNDYWEKRGGIIQNYFQLRGGNTLNDGLYFEPLSKNKARLRQGPCPEGFHVPSIGEWNKLLRMTAGSGAKNVSTLYDDLLIPFAGSRDANNASVYDVGNKSALWSSSPYVNEHKSWAIGADIYGNLDIGESYRAGGASIRCFYNEYDSYIEAKPITNIDISNIPEPTLGKPGITWVLDITPTPLNSINVFGEPYEPHWWAKRVGRDCLMGEADCQVFSGESDQWTLYSLLIRYNPARGYKVTDDLTITTDSNRHSEIISQYEPSDGFYSIKINYLPSEIPMGIERVNLYGDILPLVHGTIPTKNITTNTSGVTLGNITWGKGDNCTPLADDETIDASNSKYCLSIDIITASGYTPTFDYEIFLNDGHWIGYYDGDGTYACTSSLIKNQKITPRYKVEFISSGEVIDTRYREHGCTLAVCTNYGDGLRKPYKKGYNFEGWYADENFNTSWNRNSDTITKNTKIYAKWTENPSGEGEIGDTPNQTTIGYSGGGKRTTVEISDNEDRHDNTKNDNSTEFEQAYEFVYKNGITTMDTIEKADIQGGLTRIAMAKMLSQYAINVLGQRPANIIVPNFIDIPKELDDEYDYGVSLAYQLGIMGINIPNNKFRPFDLVTRAEFATALSRMLYKLADGDPYYVTHMIKLKKEGIIMNDDPEMFEIRGYVMIMLMRSAM